jgi:hypothetical protein
MRNIENPRQMHHPITSMVQEIALSSATLSNLEARKNGFGLSDLSHIFQDALEVTRALKV